MLACVSSGGGTVLSRLAGSTREESAWPSPGRSSRSSCRAVVSERRSPATSHRALTHQPGGPALIQNNQRHLVYSWLDILRSHGLDDSSKR